MNNLKGFEKARQNFPAFKLSQLNLIKEFSVKAVGTEDCELTLVLESHQNEASPRWRAAFVFQGVRDLALGTFHGSGTQHVGFDILDLSDSQMEDVKFKIVDYEGGLIKAYAKVGEVLEVLLMDQ